MEKLDDDQKMIFINDIDNRFYALCEKDINDLYNKIKIFIPKTYTKEFFYSDDTKEVIFKPIFDDYLDEVGLGVYINDKNNNTMYDFEYKNDQETYSVTLRKKYYNDENELIEKEVSVTLDDNTVYRDFAYAQSGSMTISGNDFEIGNMKGRQEYLNSISIFDDYENSIIEYKKRKKE